MVRPLVIVSLLSAGCASTSPSALTGADAPTVTTAAPTGVPTVPDCAERVALLSHRLEQAAARETTIVIDPALEVPRVEQDVGERLPEAPLVELRAKRLAVDGLVVEDIGELRDLLEKKRELWRALTAGSQPTRWVVVLVADKSLPRKELARLVAALDAEGWSAYLLVRISDASPIETHPPAWAQQVRERLSQSTLEGTLRALGDAMRRAASGCDPLAEALQRVDETATDPYRIPTSLALAVPEAVSVCECTADVDAVEALLVWVIGGSGTRLRGIELVPERYSASAELAAAGDLQVLVHELIERPRSRAVR